MTTKFGTHKKRQGKSLQVTGLGLHGFGEIELPQCPLFGRNARETSRRRVFLWALVISPL